MYESWEVNDRIVEAKRLTERLVDRAHYLLDIRENNAIVVYSDQLSKQIPRSYAANAFNIFREAMHQIEIVRLNALWDQAHVDNEAIMSVVEFIDAALDGWLIVNADSEYEVGTEEGKRG